MPDIALPPTLDQTLGPRAYADDGDDRPLLQTLGSRIGRVVFQLKRRDGIVLTPDSRTIAIGAEAGFCLG